MLSILDPLFKQSMDEMPQLYEDCKPGSVKYRNDNEPHLVKYTGDVHKGVCMHTDSAEITLNIALSDPDDFEGGGTYFECLDKVSEICKTVPENPLADFEGYTPPGAKSPKKTVKYNPPKMDVNDTSNNRKVAKMNSKIICKLSIHIASI